MKNAYVIEYLNENEFRKKERSIKKYNMLAYKKMMFDYYPSFRDGEFKGVAVSKNTKDGITKYEGEEAVRSLCEKYYVARTSWLYGHHGKNFVETMLKLADNNEVNVVDDQVGCPTWTVELANGIVKLLSKPYGTYHICGSGSTSWYGFAKEIFAQSNLDVNLHPCKTEAFPRPAKRPSYSVMENNGICRNWQAALKDYLNLRDV